MTFSFDYGAVEAIIEPDCRQWSLMWPAWLCYGQFLRLSWEKETWGLRDKRNLMQMKSDWGESPMLNFSPETYRHEEHHSVTNHTLSEPTGTIGYPARRVSFDLPRKTSIFLLSRKIVTCDQAPNFSWQEGTPDTITWLFVCRPLIKISVSENVGVAIRKYLNSLRGRELHMARTAWIYIICDQASLFFRAAKKAKGRLITFEEDQRRLLAG